MPTRVLLVEDLKRMEALLGEMFSALDGFEIVASVPTEAEAYLWLTEHPGEWDLAVIDLVLAQGTGMGVIRRARDDPRAGQVVVFSSFVSPGIRRHCLGLGADAVFDKADGAAFLAWCGDLVAGGKAHRGGHSDDSGGR